MDVFVGSVVIDVNDLERMRTFWEAVLGYEADLVRNDWVKLVPRGSGVNVSLQLVPDERKGKNRLHLDLYSKHRDQEVERISGLGAAVVDRDSGGDFVVLADPEGNLFCVIDKSGDG